MLKGEQTDISLRIFIEETDRDPELHLLKQAILDNNRKQNPAAYRLYENDFKFSTGLLMIGDLILVPKTLREWIKQVAHGDHASAHKMMEIPEMVHWPAKKADLEKSKPTV